MKFRNHSELEGAHALLSPSKYYWIGYDQQKLMHFYEVSKATEKGTELHALACSLIKNRIKLPKSKATLNMYVNDAIGYQMKPEQVLFYSYECFGTADAISFKNDFLRIHDLKTGTNPAHMEQLEIYAALFFLEYGTELKVHPKHTKIELRIYQNNEVFVEEPNPQTILDIMTQIQEASALIEKIKQEEI